MTISLLRAVIFILLLILYRVVRKIKNLEAHISSLNLIIDSACNIDYKPSNHMGKGVVQISKRRSSRAYRRGSDYTDNDPYGIYGSSGSSYDSSSSSGSSYDSSSSSSSSDYSGGGGGFSGGGSSGSWD